MVKLCGDCIVLSGTNGFIGTGRIPHLADAGAQVESQSRRIYVRRLLHSFHGDDAIVNVLATPRPADVSEDTFGDIAKSLLASADDLGSLCIWHRDCANPGSTDIPTSSPTSSRSGYNWTCIHHAKVGHKITAMSFAPDGHTLAVCTVERAILFDIGSVLTLAVASTASCSTERRAAPRPRVRTLVIDDTVGLSPAETVFAVDLSCVGILKVWKVAEGFDLIGSGSSVDDATVGRASSSDRNTGNMADRVTFVEMSLMHVLQRCELSVSLIELYHTRPCGSAESLGSSISTAATSATTAATTDRSLPCEEGSDEDKPETATTTLPDTEPLLQPVERNKGHEVRGRHESQENGESGFFVDPFGYADVFVIDPLRMHLRDWWCDYSSRYLLLGHGRVSALTNFESSSMSTYSYTCAVFITLYANCVCLSFFYHCAARPSEKTDKLSTTGLNKRSSSMFWSTLTSSLGRRVICRYYIPQSYHERRKQGVDIKLDCLHFVLVLARCLYETLGEEYYAALLCAWKSSALDFARDTLEKMSSSWFRDITTTFHEVLRRMELSPSLALNALDELIAAVGSEGSNGQYSAGAKTVDVNAVLDMFKKLRNGLCVIADDYGIMHVVNADRKAFIMRGIRPPPSSNSGKNRSDNMLLGITTDGWEGEDACHLARALVIDPLAHLERTEPFAVALAIVGLQLVPKFIYNSVMSQDDNMRAALEQQASSSEDRSSAEKLAASVKANKMSATGSEDVQERSIEGLISVMAKEMPPWIRFILTSDTSDCDATG